jgi:cephalosporin hydroxylase
MGKAEENLAYFNTGEWLRQEYKGIRILKYPSDLDHYKQILAETKPDLIIETGTLDGASALWFRDHSKASIWTIDTDDRVENHYSGIDYVVGDALLANISTPMSKRVMVVLDSDHRKDHVLAELKKFAPLVTKGCYLVVEDTFISQYLNNDDSNNDYSDGSSWEALQEWGAEGFKTMPEPELTMNPGGWLMKL